MVTEVAIAQWHRLDLGQAIAVEPKHYTVALDGERALNVNPEQQLEVVLRRNGPAIVDVQEVMKEAAAAGLLRR
jgi:hypothetical protein